MKAICTTTINPVTKALRKFVEIAERDDWHIFIAGDTKTPEGEYRLLEENHKCVTYLSPSDQEDISLELSNAIGWKCIQRRNFAILAAYIAGAEVMALVDDDNIPYEFWGSDLLIGKTNQYETHTTSQLVFEPLTAAYRTKDNSEIWHRGFPIQMLPQKRKEIFRIEKGVMTPLVQADLWNGDPDIDAVCRITNAPDVEFSHKMSPFTSNKPMPFNSQNTFIHRSIVPTYFLFPYIGRMDDIWAAYMTQYKFPNSVVFNRPSVYQERNPHDLSKDLDNEIIGYKHTIDFVDYLFNGTPAGKPFPSWFPVGAVNAYQIWKKVVKSYDNVS